MAQMYVLLYRLRALDQLRAERPAADADQDTLWQATSPLVLHQRMHYFADNDRLADLDQLRSQPVVSDYLLPALRHLGHARDACPLVPEVHLTIAQLCGLREDPSDDRTHVQRTRRLAPGYPGLLFDCGLLDFQAGRFDSAWNSWRTCLTLAPENLDAVLERVGPRIRDPGTIQSLLPESPGLLIQLARERYSDDRDTDVRLALISRADVLLDHVDLPEPERSYLSGLISASREDYPVAVASLQAAVRRRPQEVVWRYELARVLQVTGDLEAAREQAKMCARTAPRDPKYRDFLRQVIQQQLKEG